MEVIITLTGTCLIAITLWAVFQVSERRHKHTPAHS